MRARKAQRQARIAAAGFLALGFTMTALCYVLAGLPCNHSSEFAADVHGYLTVFSGVLSFFGFAMATVAAVDC